MSSGDQLELIEPEGEKLVELCLNNLALWRSESRKADYLDSCCFEVAADLLHEFADAAFERAAMFESAYQFERLAGLS